MQPFPEVLTWSGILCVMERGVNPNAWKDIYTGICARAVMTVTGVSWFICRIDRAYLHAVLNKAKAFVHF